MEKFNFKSALSTALVGNLVFAIINIAIVTTHILLPRILNKPDVRIERVSAIADEKELEISGTTRAEVLTMLSADVSSEFRYSGCADLLRRSQVAAQCAPTIAREIDNYLLSYKRAIQEMSEEQAQLEVFLQLDPAERSERFRRGEYDGRLSDVAANAITIENYVKEDFHVLLTTTSILARINFLKGEVERNKQVVEILEGFVNQLQGSQTQQERSGQIILRVVVSNRGYADAILPPNAILRLSGESIPLSIQTSPDEVIVIESGVAPSSSTYSILPASHVAIVNYAVDQQNASERELRAIQSALANYSAEPFELVLRVENENVVASDHLPRDTRSIEVDRQAF